MRVRRYGSLEQLPESYGELLADGARESFYYSLPWFQNIVATAAETGDEVCFYGIERDREPATPLALLVCRAPLRRRKFVDARSLAGFSTMFTTLFGIPFSSAVDDRRAVIRALVEAICSERPRWEVMRLDALDRESPVFDQLSEALKRSGMVVQHYKHFENWYETTDGKTSEDYFNLRPSKLRNTIARKQKKLTKSANWRFELITGGAEVEKGIAAYATVYEGSWKRPEPHPHFIPGLIRACGAAGVLRLGILFVDETPAAAQFWIASNRRATIYKLAYDENFARLSVGSILTKKMMEHVIDVDRVREVDFGRGGDSYKQDWMSCCRERWGIVAFNPRTVRGAMHAGYHLGRSRAKHALTALTRRRPRSRTGDGTD
ncbi:MAG: GNAT family N-acetyltransferase [Alphaproteobacteria bacterium]